MRIISGSHGGRRFDSPGSSKTHPMSDKARGALFNVLGDIEELTVLDVFAGSGALSFEAISRGAKSAVAIELDRPAQKVIEANTHSLGFTGRVKLIKASASAWLATNPDATFDIVLCDPPYNDLQAPLIIRLAGCVAPDGILVLSWPTDQDLPQLELPCISRKNYGDASLAFFGNPA